MMKNLKLALRLNGTFSIVSGILSVFFAKELMEIFELPKPLLFYVLGPGLILFGLSAILESNKDNNRKNVLIITISDYAWVLGSIVLLAIGLPENGAYIVEIVALCVLFFAIHQSVALKHSHSQAVREN
jgi:hypothetical protein